MEMHNFLNFFNAPFFIIFQTLCLAGSEAVTERQLAVFGDFVQRVTACRGVTGMAVTLVKDNELVWSRGFGHANREEGIEATNFTKFSVGSLTKAFTTAILVKILAEHPRYTLDTPLKEILGEEFRLVDQYRTDNVNLRDLVAHKVGIPGYFNLLLVGLPENLTRLELARLIACQPALHPLRTKFLYSNFMFSLAGYVAEVISGRKWEDLVYDVILKPLGMDKSGFVDEVSHFDDSFAKCYVYINGTPVPVYQKLLHSVSPLGPAGSLYSTGIDMAKWMNFHLSGGKNQANESLIDQDVLSATYNNEMAKPFPNEDMYKPLYPVTDALVSYDLGWATSVYRGYKKLWHSGGIVEFSSILWLFPDVQAGVFVSLSGSTGNRNRVPLKMISRYASDLLLGLDPWVNDTIACSTTWSQPNKKPVDLSQPKTHWNITNDMSLYEGTYFHPAFLHIRLVREEKDLVMYYGRFGKLVLTPFDDCDFRARFVGPLSYVTQSDNARPPFRVTFSFQTKDGLADFLSFPVDNNHTVQFSRTNYRTPKRTCSDPVTSSSYHVMPHKDSIILLFYIILTIL